MGLDNSEYLRFAKAAIKKWAELVCEEIDRERIDELDTWEQLYLRALWMKRLRALAKITGYITKEDDERKKYDLVVEMIGDQLGVPREDFEPSLKRRLGWMKHRVAKEFEKKVLGEVSLHGITSPIEQIFLMEWLFGRYSERLGVRLIPQKAIATDRGKYIVDFLISPTKSEKELARIAIELDGHDFHEKTREQVKRDKKRERALVLDGITVLRFSGSEVFQNPRACIEEIADFFSSS